MAKLTFGPIVSDARKKIAGTVFTKVKSGSMARKKVSPIQPRTPAQTAVRALFATLSKRWATVLIDSQRAGWVALAALYPVKDKLGASHVRTGLQMYQACNRHLQTLGITTYLDSPPSDQSVESLASLSATAALACAAVLTGVTVTGNEAVYDYSSYTGNAPAVGMSMVIAGFVINPTNNGTFVVTASTGGPSGSFTVTKVAQVSEVQAATGNAKGLSLTFTPSPLDSNMYLVVAASKQVSQGVTTAFKGLALIYVGAGADSSPVNLLSAYTTKYGALIYGRKISLAGYVINSGNGAASRRMTTTATVA
jgi:hypothetical protein